MKSSKISVFLRYFSCIAALSAVALSSEREAGANLSVMDFKANGYYANQASGGNTYTGQLSWNPEMDMGGWGIMGNLGVALLKSGFDDKFVSLNYQVMAKVPVVGPLHLEAGGGMETWVNNGGTHPILGGNLVVSFPKMAFINSVFAGYSRYLLTNNGTNEFRLGVGITL